MKYVVIHGYEDKKTLHIEAEYCIGVFDTIEEAYGEAYYCLSELIKRIQGEEDNTLTITMPDVLYDENVCERIDILGQTYITDYVKIFFYEEKESK